MCRKYLFTVALKCDSLLRKSTSVNDPVKHLHGKYTFTLAKYAVSKLLRFLYIFNMCTKYLIPTKASFRLGTIINFHRSGPNMTDLHNVYEEDLRGQGPAVVDDRLAVVSVPTIDCNENRKHERLPFTGMASKSNFLPGTEAPIFILLDSEW